MQEVQGVLTSAQAAPTGDETPVEIYLFLLLMSLMAAGRILMEVRERKRQRKTGIDFLSFCVMILVSKDSKISHLEFRRDKVGGRMDFITIGEMVIDFLPGQEEGSYIRNAGGAPQM